MTTHYDALSCATPGICANCETRVDRLIKTRCRLCHEYWHKYRIERPARLWQPFALAWEEFDPEEPGPDESTWCDCGRPAAWWLIVPISERGTARLRLCKACRVLEERLAPIHSWKGG